MAMIIKQIKSSFMDNFSYVIGCPDTGEGAVIDPAGDAEIILRETRGAGLTVRYIFNTHNHPDHTEGNRAIRKATGAKVLMHALDARTYPGEVDIVVERDDVVALGTVAVSIIHTPGHTPGGICFLTEGNLFTGDTLFVGDSGRTDLPGGHRPTLGASIRKLMALPADTVVWPGHDYGPTPSSTLRWEKRNNVNAREYGYYEEG